MITRDDVEKAARLSRLRLEPGELDALAHDLERVVGYVEQLMAVDVEGVEPMTQPFAEASPRRADEPRPVLGRAAVAGGPGYDDGLVKVPKVIE